jgi:hypothetical protein
MPNEEIDITKEEFSSYVRVQLSGVTNMFDVNRVQSLSGLTRQRILKIMKEYSQLEKKYPDVKETEQDEDNKD